MAMKIDSAIREAYKEQEAVANALRKEVDADVQTRKRRTWHYESRVKSLESFALKVETGRVSSLGEVEDVFGATLVVPDWSQISAAEAMIVERYKPAERRPKSSTMTKKSPDSFRFDDVRLYVRYERASFEKTRIPDGTLFEVQVKTFLQHAWAVSTHDVVYKTPGRDWRRERIAHQVRAALESAEVAIGSIEALSSSDVLPGQNDEIAELNSIISALQENWPETALPSDVRRLAENIQAILLVCYRDRTGDRPAHLRALLAEGLTQNSGAHSVDWSPYRSVLNYLAKERSTNLRQRLRSGSARKVLVYPEVLDTLGISESEAAAALVAGT